MPPREEKKAPPENENDTSNETPFEKFQKLAKSLLAVRKEEISREGPDDPSLES